MIPTKGKVELARLAHSGRVAERLAAAENPYLSPGMPLDRVRQDALAGVRLAREAWRSRDPSGAARELGAVVEPAKGNEVRNQEVNRGQ